MIDIITHIPDLDAFRLEASTMADNEIFGFTKDEDGNVVYNITKIPVHYGKNNDSVCLVRIMTNKEQESFDLLETVHRLGVCENGEYIFDDNCETIYDSVYDQTPVTYTDEDGVEYTYTPPKKIGVIA